MRPLAGRDETLRVLGIDPFRALRLQPGFVAGGGANVADSAALLDARSAWLSPAAAARLGFRKGDTFRTLAASSAVEWKVAGVLEGLAGAGVVAVVDIAAAQQRFARLGRLSRIDVRLRPGVDSRAASRALASILPPASSSRRPHRSPRAPSRSRAPIA
jgi:putative ABC transport system permease protein